MIRPRERAEAAALLTTGVLAAALLFGPAAWSATYVHDDAPAHVDNPLVTWPPDLRALATQPWFGPDPKWRFQGLSRPLVTLGYCVEAGLGLDGPGPRHAVNVLLYGLVAGLLAIVVGDALRLVFAPPRLTRVAAWFALAFFVIHPAHVSSVMVVAYRPELQSLCFVLLATWSLLLHLRGELGVRSATSAFGLTFAAALLSKESSVAAVVPWGLLAWTTRGRSDARARPSWLAVVAFGLVGTLLVWRAAIFGDALIDQIPAWDNPLATLPTAQRIRGALAIVAYAAGHLLWPFGLAPDYTLAVWSDAPQDMPAVLTGAAAVVGVAALFAWAVARGHRRPAVALAVVALTWAAAFYLPVSSLLFPSTVQYAVRLLTAPSGSLIALVATLLAMGALRVPLEAQSARAAVALVPVALATAQVLEAREAAGHYTNEIALFRYGSIVQPRSVRMQYDLSHRLYLAERYEEALVAADAATAIDPTHPEPAINRLQCLARLRRCEAPLFAPGAPFATEPPQAGAPMPPGIRLALVDRHMACLDFAAAWQAGSPLDARTLPPQRAVHVYLAGVVSGHGPAAAAWARPAFGDPTRHAGLIAGVAWGFEQAGKPGRALDIMEKLAATGRPPPGLQQAAAGLCARHPEALAERCPPRWPDPPERWPARDQGATRQP
jgi:hypothetical protein